jgi:hypothetical protein
MRKIIFLAVILLTGTVSMINAQDVITKKNGEELRVKVIEIGLSEVRYKLYDNQDGPNYSIPNSDIFRLKYEDGPVDPKFPIKESGTGNSVRWGVKLGANLTTLAVSDSDYDFKNIIGAVGGVTLFAPLFPNGGIHTGLEISMKGFGDNSGTCRAIYLQAPVELGIKIKFGNSGWYFEPRAGLYLAYGIAGKVTADGESGSVGTFSDKVLKPFDLGFSGGFYFGNDKFSIGLRGEPGLIDVKGDVLNTVTDDITMRNNNVSLVVGFAF